MHVLIIIFLFLCANDNDSTGGPILKYGPTEIFQIQCKLKQLDILKATSLMNSSISRTLTRCKITVRVEKATAVS